jgi:hypothetical protein
VYPDIAVGNGFVFVHVQTSARFQHPNLFHLHKSVSDHCKANGFALDNDEFEENVCRNTPNIVCGEGTRGVGDMIHGIAQPLARLADSLTGSNLAGCGGCFKRQHELNG